MLIALVSQVSLFTSQPDLYRELISAIFHYNWDLEWKIRVSLVNLIYHMVTANALLLLPSLQLLVKSLQYRDNFTSEESLPVDSFNTFLTRPNDLYSLVHRTIRCLTSICPSGQSSLFPILSTNFPYKMDPISDHHNYTTHLLVICQYLPLQQFTILELIISKCVEIDVEIHIEDTGEVKLQISESNELFDLSSASHCSQFAPHQEIADSSCSLLNGAPHTPGASSSPHLNDVSEMADKLDSMLLLLLSFLDSKINEEGVIKEKVLNQILKIFENQILLTHKSKFVQFLLFYLASKDSKFATLIPKFLSSFFFDERSSFLKRQSAVVYLGSYLARANFVSASLARYDKLLCT